MKAGWTINNIPTNPKDCRPSLNSDFSDRKN